MFGIVLAYAPQIQGLTAQLKVQYTQRRRTRASTTTDGKPIGILTANNAVLPAAAATSRRSWPHAIVAIEDKRFYTEPGVDSSGIVRAFVADVFHTGGGTQGGSTITEQFVKIALHQEQQNRTVLEKLREAAMAFQLVAPVVEAEDPRRVPQHRLLRQRRHGRRGGGAGLLRQRPGLDPLRLRRARRTSTTPRASA